MGKFFFQLGRFLFPVRACFFGNLYFTALLIDEGKETFVGEIFLGDFLYLLRGDFVYLLVEMLDVLEPAIMEVALAEVEGEVLTVVASHSYLSLNLLLAALSCEGLRGRSMKCCNSRCTRRRQRSMSWTSQP